MDLRQIIATPAELGRTPATWILAGIAITLVQTGYWLGTVRDDAFDPGNPAESFLIGVTMLEHLGVAFTAVLAVAILARTNTTQEKAPGLIVRTTTVLVTLVLLTVLAYATLLPAIAWADLAGWSPEQRSAIRIPAWTEMIVQLGRVLLGCCAYAVLTALLAVATGSRAVAAVTTIAHSLFEGILLDLLIGDVEALEWVFGVIMSWVYYHFVWREDALGAMVNVLGLDNDTQGMLVFAGYSLCLGVLEWCLRRFSRGPY